MVLDFAAERERLHDLVHSADLVLESSRPRALSHLGLVAEDVVAFGTSWLSITACGRASEAVGFGDDVAARAGFVLPDGDDLLPVGDALADPLAGVAAAVAAAEALTSLKARLIDVSMLHVAAALAIGAPEPHRTFRSNGQWLVECASGIVPVFEPVVTA